MDNKQKATPQPPRDTRTDEEFNALMRRRAFEMCLVILKRARNFSRAEKLARTFSDSEIAELLPIYQQQADDACKAYGETLEGKAYLAL